MARDSRHSLHSFWSLQYLKSYFEKHTHPSNVLKKKHRAVLLLWTFRVAPSHSSFRKNKKYLQKSRCYLQNPEPSAYWNQQALLVVNQQQILLGDKVQNWISTILLNTLKWTESNPRADGRTEAERWHEFVACSREMTVAERWHEFEQAPGVGDGQGSLACCSLWGQKESDMTEWLNWTQQNDAWELLMGMQEMNKGTRRDICSLGGDHSPPCLRCLP